MPPIWSVRNRLRRKLGSYGSPPQPQTNVSKAGAGLPSTVRMVISVSLSALTTWTLNSTPISWAISAISFAAWVSDCDSERTNRSNDSVWSPFVRGSSPLSCQPASSRICFARSTSGGS